MTLWSCVKKNFHLMKSVEGVVFQKLWKIGHQKYPTYVHCSTPNPKSVSVYDPPFSKYFTISH